ncbi:TetR/AcrR family transcriptional regulator [Leuconostoc litchii]|uniref:TetR/AcrR family transcriptional regulator n=1 Tax=Leuconostoc litchii TaxID=1981069 RepID=A0A6P2CNL2_9LACO|nr:TetR/AcrR family transcriptional regulator [Leuconostoc litchii]TYC47638.1 TetR/AcrR family transcriptional regulator [Leuconostoc litchii]
MGQVLSQSEHRRQQIIDAATIIFLSKGFEQTTTRDIAKSVDISQPALYHHFGDKQTLFVEVITHVGGLVHNDMQQILTATYVEPIDQLVDLTQVIISRHPKDVFRLIHDSFESLSGNHKSQLGMIFGHDYVAPIAQFFETIPLRNHISAQEASSFYITSLSPLFGDFHALGENLTSRQRIQQLVDLILYGVEKK